MDNYEVIEQNGSSTSIKADSFGQRHDEVVFYKGPRSIMRFPKSTVKYIEEKTAASEKPIRHHLQKDADAKPERYND